MGCLLTIPFLVIFFILFFGSAIFRILQAVFGWKSSEPGGWKRTHDDYGQGNNQQTNDRYYQQNSSKYQQNPNGKRRKIFDDDEGEYVDFEEIKDDK